MKFNKKALTLYGITDRHWVNEHNTLYEDVERALQGGVTMIQLREKNITQGEFLEEAIEIRRLCRAYHVPFIINDNVEIAEAVDADGIHVGQDDMLAKDVRWVLGDRKIIGVSAHSVEEAIQAERNGADYLGVGSAFETKTKSDISVLDHQVYVDICRAVKIPVVAIGGITQENVMELAGTGIAGVAVVGAIFGRKDVRKSAKELKEKTIQMMKFSEKLEHIERPQNRMTLVRKEG